MDDNIYTRNRRRVVRCRGCQRPLSGAAPVCATCREGLDGLDWYGAVGHEPDLTPREWV